MMNGVYHNHSNSFLNLYYKMALIRSFEEKVLAAFDINNSSKIFGTTHVYIGQEAIAVGACSAILNSDFITSTHRGHGHFLAKGGDPKRIMAELYGKVTGYCKGKGGTQHMGDISIGHLGSNGITGGGIPLATGAAFSIKYRETNDVVLCFFGDGAVNEGVFHESLNMASLWKLPIVYICENNYYAMSTPTSKAFAKSEIHQKASAYDMEGFLVDGMDVLDVLEKSKKAVMKARNGGGPSLLECQTYRYGGHSKNDLCQYRTREEEEIWKNRDPLKQLKEKILAQKISEEEIIKVHAIVQKVVEESIEYADKSPFPTEDELHKDIFA